MVLTHIDLKYVSLIYRKIRQKVPNGKGLKETSTKMYTPFQIRLNLQHGPYAHFRALNPRQ